MSDTTDERSVYGDESEDADPDLEERVAQLEDECDQLHQYLLDLIDLRGRVADLEAREEFRETVLRNRDDVTPKPWRDDDAE